MPFLRKYGTLLVTGTTSVRIPIIKRAVVDFALGADWTPAAGDVKVFIDAAASANITNLPTAIASGNGAFWEFILTAAELTCKQLLVVVSDAATKAVEDQSFIVETFGNTSAMYVSDISSGTAEAATFTVGSSSTTTSIVTSAIAPAAAVADQFKNRVVLFDNATTTANLRGQASLISANTSGGVLTVGTLTTAPVSGDTGRIL